MGNTMKFEKISFGKRVKSMLKVDFRRMSKSKLFYILIACALVLPVIMTVMMAMMDGSVSVNPQTGEETVMEGPENASRRASRRGRGLYDVQYQYGVYGCCRLRLSVHFRRFQKRVCQKSFHGSSKKRRIRGVKDRIGICLRSIYAGGVFHRLGAWRCHCGSFL